MVPKSIWTPLGAIVSPPPPLMVPLKLVFPAPAVIVRVCEPRFTLLLAAPVSVVIEAPAVVPEISNVAAAVVRPTPLDAAMLPVPVKASVPASIVVAPV